MNGVMHVYLLRHGEAADLAPDGSYDDEARELTAEGIDKLGRACAVYARFFDDPPRILHSPLIRARQSAEILATALGVQAADLTETGELRPGGRATQVVDMLQAEFLNGCSAMALVGHEPLLGDLLGMLSTGNDRFSTPMGKGMLACVRLTEAQVMIGRILTLVSQAQALRLG